MLRSLHKLSFLQVLDTQPMEFTWPPKLLFLEQTTLDTTSQLTPLTLTSTLVKFVNLLPSLPRQVLMVNL
jgi:hypothetical protein